MTDKETIAKTIMELPIQDMYLTADEVLRLQELVREWENFTQFGSEAKEVFRKAKGDGVE